MKTTWLVVVASVLCVPLASLAQKEAAGCPDDLDTTGKYVNSSYGFSILVPRNLKGLWNSAACASTDGECVCMSDHGRIIPLSADEGDADHWIEAYAGFSTELDEPTLANAVASRIDWVHERSRKGTTSVIQRSNDILGGLEARRVVVRYVDKKTKRVMVEDFVLAFRGKREAEIEYSVYLRSPIKSYTRDKAIFEQVLKSFARVECDDCR